RWEELKGAMDRGGAAEVIRVIDAIEDPETRRTIYAVAQKRFGKREWAERNFDALVEIVTEGIGDTLQQALVAADGEEAWKLTDFANRLSYNLSADLAECWPGDQAPRERQHFEAGLRAAEDCIRWRRELGKPPDRRAMAYWAAGMHQLSLSNLHEARGAFETASGLARLAVVGTGRDEVKAGSDFGVLLYAGYLGIVRAMIGEAEGRAQYEAAGEAFDATAAAAEGEEKEDAVFGAEQLRWVARKFLSETANSRR
ncbi:MAG: hypothetical protein ACRENN_04665, partial [Candidatus Eiseniibacteriota bacterium]